MKTVTFTASSLVDQVASGGITSRAITEAFLDRISKAEPSVHAFVHVSADAALRAADSADKARAARKAVGPLAGIPIAIKDLICTVDMPTTCGSKILQNFRSPYDATVVEKLKAAGMIILGKTNMDEFAMGGSTETSFQGPTHNPWDLSRTAGGSSGGAAACLAAGQAPLSIGSDTGGSIRQPAAFCGVCGLKPTYGRISRYGLVAFASSLDQMGPMAHTVRDLAMLLQVMAGADHRDSTCIDSPVPNYQESLVPPKHPLRIGIVREHLDNDGLDPEIRKSIEQAIDVYRQSGAKIVEVSLPNTRYSIPTYYVIAASEASSNLSRYDGAHYGYRAPIPALSKNDERTPLIQMYCDSRSQGFGSEVKRRIMLGTYTLSAGYYDAYYLKALKVRRLIRQDYDRAFALADVLIGPVTPTPPFKLGEKLDNPLQMYLVDLFTVGANLAGIPSLSIPCGRTSAGLPMGLQLQAAPLAEPQLLQAGHWYQTITKYEPQWALS